MKFTSHDGELEILSDGRLRIQKGKKAAGKTISMKDIVSVVLIMPKFTAAGCIYIQVYGGKEYPAYANVTHYAMNANTVCFRKPQLDEALAFKDALEKEIAARK